MDNLFQDRTEAGQVLAGRLQYLARRPDVLILAISRGSARVAAAVARDLRAALDIFLVRPVVIVEYGNLTVGAVAPGGVLVVDEKLLRALNISEDTLNVAASMEGRELDRRETICRSERDAMDANGKIVILIDDGASSPVAMRAAIVALRQFEPVGIIVALPVAAPELCAELEDAVEQMVCLENQEREFAVGLYYWHFPEVTDREVAELLLQASDDLREAHQPSF